MTIRDLIKLFEAHGSEYLKFDRIEEPHSLRPDLHAFLLLDELCPGGHDIVAGATHDKFFLSVNLSNLLDVNVTEAQVIELVRCGVMVDDDYYLAMFA